MKITIHVMNVNMVSKTSYLTNSPKDVGVNGKCDLSTSVWLIFFVGFRKLRKQYVLLSNGKRVGTVLHFWGWNFHS